MTTRKLNFYGTLASLSFAVTMGTALMAMAETTTGAPQASAKVDANGGLNVQASGVQGAARAQVAADPGARTRDLLIEKLGQVQLNLAPQDPSRTAITLRLADLYSERARVNSMRELSEGCTVCNAGKADREKALAFYQDVLPKMNDAALGKVLAQVGHLFEMTGREQEAIATYDKILAANKSPEANAEAHLSLAEVYFKRHDYAQAKTHFAAVLAIPQAQSKGLAAYRLAWCDFNQGQLPAAIEELEHVLRTPELLTRSGSPGVVQVDRQFQEEVSLDFATFLARRPVQMADVQKVYDLSPEAAKLPNTTYLASETERLGQTQAAIQIWRFCQERQTKPQARLEGQLHLAQLEMESKDQKNAIRDFNSALSLWNSLGGCSTDDCKELKQRLRKFVLDWNRVEKKNPSPELLAAYQEYLKVFPQEGDMTLWTAQVAKDRKDYPLAVDLYEAGAHLEQQAKNTTESETALLGAIEAAELSGDVKLQYRAYDLYLQESKDQKHTLEVRYQKAHLLYEKADYAAAVTALREVALDATPAAKAETKIRKQAAELSLDGLVLLKDDARLETWAKEYASVFPDAGREFASIARKAVLNQSASVATVQPSASTSGGAATGGATALNGTGADAAWSTLMRFDLTNASDEEKAIFYKNKLVLAEKLQKFSEARDAADQLLRLPGVSVKDQQFALSRKAWLSEMVLDFDGALNATAKLSTAELNPAQKDLKLAMYADLAAKDSGPYLAAYLKDSQDSEKKAAIAAQLVRESKDPVKEWEKQKASFGKDPQIVADLGLELYARTGNADFIKKSLVFNGVGKTPAGQTMARVLFMNDYDQLVKKMDAAKLDGSTQKKMAATLKARMALMEQAEKLATRGVESADWTSQLLSLDLLAKQSERFYQDILALPVPAGLSGEDEQQYLMLLSQQAAPHQTRAKDVAAKVSEFWKNDAALTQIQKAMQTSTGAGRVLLSREVKELAQIVPSDRKDVMDKIASTQADVRTPPSLAALEGARQAVRDRPMDREKLQALLDVEKQMTTLSLNHAAMVSYLEGRLQTLPTEDKK